MKKFQKKAENCVIKTVLGLRGVPALLQQRGAVTKRGHLRDFHSPLVGTHRIGSRLLTFQRTAHAWFENCGSNLFLLKALDGNFLLNVLNTNQDF